MEEEEDRGQEMNQGANERGEVKNGLKRLSQDVRESERERE